MPMPPQDPQIQHQQQVLHALKTQTEYLQRISNDLRALRSLVDGFTDQGASFRAAGVDATTLAFLAMVGQVLGDRLDGQLTGVRTSEEYREQFLRAAAIMAREALKVVDEFRTEQAPRQALEDAFSEGR
jgi:hypothetical protein